MLFCSSPSTFSTRAGIPKPVTSFENTHLVRVRDPETLGANVRDSLVLVPVVGLGKRLVDHVVKVAKHGERETRLAPGSCVQHRGCLQVVGEDDVSVEEVER